jgi:hypothetical protein
MSEMNENEMNVHLFSIKMQAGCQLLCASESTSVFLNLYVKISSAFLLDSSFRVTSRRPWDEEVPVSEKKNSVTSVSVFAADSLRREFEISSCVVNKAVLVVIQTRPLQYR